MSADLLLTAIRSHLDLMPDHVVLMEPIKKGASGRTTIRLRPEGHPSYIGVHYDGDREDNANFLPIAQFLKKAGLRVPEILYHNLRHRTLLVEDLGEVDLLELKEQPFAERARCYEQVFEQMDRLYYTKCPKDLELQKVFDVSLYQWEQGYFVEHLVEGLLGIADHGLHGHPALEALAERLGSSSPHLVHRDLQSQNVMVFNEQAYLIDFQGLRYGRQEYDLASLLYDPYMDLEAAEREELLERFADITEERPFPDLLRDCAAQRLMQALGAYGNMVRNQGLEWYYQHIPTAVRSLCEVVRGSDLEKPLLGVLEGVDIEARVRDLQQG